MIGVTVSTKYSDILDIVFPQNAKFFDKWYIITSPDDEDTINVINKHNFGNVELRFFDFYNGAVFNKGGAIRACQNELSSLKYNGVVALIDSDIYLNDNFSQIISSIEIKPDCIYASSFRNDYYTLENFKNDIIDLKYPWSDEFQGYLQIYKHDPKYQYQNSFNCSECDLFFAMMFPKKELIKDLHVKHLGRHGDNWFGRKELNFK